MSTSSSNGHVTVYVTLPQALAEFSPRNGRGVFPMELEHGSTLSDLTMALRMPDDVPDQIFVNDRRSTPEQVLSNGAEVQIFPALNGQ